MQIAGARNITGTVDEEKPSKLTLNINKKENPTMEKIVS